MNSKTEVKQLPFLVLKPTAKIIGNMNCGCYLERAGDLAEYFMCPSHAAAPELLEAAKMVAEVLEKDYGHNPSLFWGYENLLAAILKAEGGAK